MPSGGSPGGRAALGTVGSNAGSVGDGRRGTVPPACRPDREPDDSDHREEDEDHPSSGSGSRLLRHVDLRGPSADTVAQSEPGRTHDEVSRLGDSASVGIASNGPVRRTDRLPHGNDDLRPRTLLVRLHRLPDGNRSRSRPDRHEREHRPELEAHRRLPGGHSARRLRHGRRRGPGNEAVHAPHRIR